jgi:hypothetical protein
MVDETGQAYAYVGDDPVNGADPLGLCNSEVANAYYPGPCATTAAGALKAESYIQSHVSGGGWSLTQAIHSEADYLAGVANGVVSTVTFGQVSIPEPYCGDLGWAYGTGTGFGIATTVVGGGVLGSVIRSSTAVGDTAYASDAFGANSTLFGNSSFGGEATEGLLNQSGSSWQIGWSVNVDTPGFRINTPFLDHLWLLAASHF